MYNTLTQNMMRNIIDQMTDEKQKTIRKFVECCISSDQYENIKDKITHSTIVVVGERLKQHIGDLSFVRTSPLIKDNEIFIYDESKQYECYSQNDTRVTPVWSEYRTFGYGLQRGVPSVVVGDCPT